MAKVLGGTYHPQQKLQKRQVILKWTSQFLEVFSASCNLPHPLWCLKHPHHCFRFDLALFGERFLLSHLPSSHPHRPHHLYRFLTITCIPSSTCKNEIGPLKVYLFVPAVTVYCLTLEWWPCRYWLGIF
jgi:hypothetical protein